jgi:hypothetical protein
MLIEAMLLAASAPCAFPAGFESWGNATPVAKFSELRLMPGQARDIPLKPVKESWSMRPPKTVPRPGSFGGYDRSIGAPALYRIAIGAAPGKAPPKDLQLEMWGEFGDVAVMKEETAPACTGIGKIVTVLAPNRYFFIQVHGAPSNALRILMVKQ